MSASKIILDAVARAAAECRSLEELAALERSLGRMEGELADEVRRVLEDRRRELSPLASMGIAEILEARPDVLDFVRALLEAERAGGAAQDAEEEETGQVSDAEQPADDDEEEEVSDEAAGESAVEDAEDEETDHTVEAAQGASDAEEEEEEADSEAPSVDPQATASDEVEAARSVLLEVAQVLGVEDAEAMTLDALAVLARDALVRSITRGRRAVDRDVPKPLRAEDQLLLTLGWASGVFA